MRTYFLQIFTVFVFLATQFIQAQSFFKENVYYEGEVGLITAFLITNSDGETNVFSVGGLSFRGGVGIHNNERSLFVGINTGIEGNFRRNVGILPIYLNSKFFIDLTDKAKLMLSFGYGKSFQVGPENLKGYLRKYTVGLTKENKRDNYTSIFIEINNHGFYFPEEGPKAITLNVGFNYTFL